jgi:hypothetical protein
VVQGFAALGTGADGGARTHNLRFRRPLLYPLSYARIALTIAYARLLDKRLRGTRTAVDIRSESPLTFCRPGGIIPFRSFQDVAHPRRCERRSPLPSPIAAFHVRASRRILHEKLLVITNAYPACCPQSSNTKEPTLRVFGMLGVYRPSSVVRCPLQVRESDLASGDGLWTTDK